MSISKLVKVLKKIEDEWYNWTELKEYCQIIDIDHQYVWNLLMDDSNKGKNKLVDEHHFNNVAKYRLNTRGIEFLQNQEEKGSWKPTKKEIIRYFIIFILGIISTIITLLLAKII